MTPPPASPNLAALAAMLDTPLALFGLTVPQVRMVAAALDQKGAVDLNLLPDGVRDHVRALAQRGHSVG